MHGKTSTPLLLIILLIALVLGARIVSSQSTDLKLLPTSVAHLHDPRLTYFSRLQEIRPPHAGDDALGAMQETVGLLLADPTTDWRTVRIARLRDHLVDLDEVVRRAEVEEREIDGGLEILLSGPVLAATRRVVTRHVDEVGGFRDWEITLDDLGETLRLELTAEDPAEVEVLRALGFYGFLASGEQPRERHLAVVRGL